MGGIEQMTVADIEARLGVIRAAEASHVARDLDAELAAVLRKGGDMDAVEAAQLEAERAARRLRVERVALEGQLPLAREREGGERVAAIAAEHAALANDALAIEIGVREAWDRFRAEAEAWGGLQQRALRLTHDASREAGASGAAMPNLGTFRSFVVEELVRDMNRNDISIRQHLHQPTAMTGHGLQSVELRSAPEKAA